MNFNTAVLMKRIMSSSVEAVETSSMAFSRGGVPQPTSHSALLLFRQGSFAAEVATSIARLIVPSGLVFRPFNLVALPLPGPSRGLAGSSHYHPPPSDLRFSAVYRCREKDTKTTLA